MSGATLVSIPLIAWSPAAPTPSAGAIANYSVVQGVYQVVNNRVEFTLDVTFDITGAPANTLQFTAPTTGVTETASKPARYTAAGVADPGIGWRYNGTGILVFSTAALGVTAGNRLTIQGWYIKTI